MASVQACSGKAGGDILPDLWFLNDDTDQRTADLTPDQLEEWEERAGIMEFDGGLTRTQAEREALNWISR